MIKKIIPIVIAMSSLMVMWCSKSIETIQTWDNVNLSYSASFEDWSIFKNQESIEINVWNWDIIKWIEDWIIWLKQGEEKEIKIPPELWYWKDYDNAKIQKIAKIIIDRLATKPEIWKPYKVGNLEGIIKGSEWDGDFKIFILDTNPRNTYENLMVKVKIDKITKK